MQFELNLSPYTIRERKSSLLTIVRTCTLSSVEKYKSGDKIEKRRDKVKSIRYK